MLKVKPKEPGCSFGCGGFRSSGFSRLIKLFQSFGTLEKLIFAGCFERDFHYHQQ